MDESAAQIELRLLRSARNGDFEAFTELVNRYRPRVYALARRIVGQTADAEDVTQQTFLSLIEHLDTFREESSVSTWILRIATNHALKTLRRKRTRHEQSLEAASEDDRYSTLPHPDFIAQWRDTPELLAQQAEVSALLDRALEELDEKYRVIFVLRDLEGLSTRETAEMLQLTEAAVKVRLLRARLMLRERLTRALGDETTRMIPDHQHPPAQTLAEGGTS